MKREKRYFYTLFLVISSTLILSACSDTNASTPKKETQAEQNEENKYEKLVKEKNKELELEPLQLTTYSEDVGATMKAPVYKEFYANGIFDIEGNIKKHSELKSDFVWIKVQSDEDGPTGNKMEYYTPIKDGKFKQSLPFFNGEGEYRVTVQLPSTDQENYYYDIATFTVHNVNPGAEYPVAYTPFAYDAELELDSQEGFLKGKEVFLLEGKAGNLSNNSETIMIRLNKDTESWTHVIPVEDGAFSYDIPLLYGKGIHKLEVMVPDAERENYYQTATTLYIDNESDRMMSPIDYSDIYRERGVTLDTPRFGGDESAGIYSVKGSIDPKAEFGPETSHIFISSKKDGDEALDVIPVENFQFDGSFHLRFGPGTYEVTLSVPEIKEENSDTFRYWGFAKFEVTSTGEDKRDLLPSRGVQSDAPEIISLAQELTEGKATQRDQGKAIYDYVAKNVSYDVDKFNNDLFEWDDSALKTLDKKTGVCQDYAYLTIALLRASGIEARYVEGMAGSPWPGRHAWVEANLDGQWITMDPTWGAGYVDNDDKFVAAFKEEYFDSKPEEFKKTHSRTGVKY
ncbi:transglutaminase-like domain-containing protein [Bacillus tianshenii]|uniref:transglutaminase-like domain-containing protein n=1 Tax=Sutcliffiella tianshenii TaxID=1463404 RepID=UPI001CD45A7F|nr:transglutaminase-like domain-containing protein [Bacillus tianshenii]MCA1318625.1 transglutaminase-like domain-containing protein [Bacillus tianshenii]